MLLVLIGLLVSCGILAETNNHAYPNKVQLVENLRRQLMEDNYDYLPTEEDLITPVHPPFGQSTTDNDMVSRGIRKDDMFNNKGSNKYLYSDKNTIDRDRIPKNGGEYDKFDDRDAFDNNYSINRDEDENRDIRGRINDRDNKKYEFSRSLQVSQEEAGNFIPRAKLDEDRDETPSKGHRVSKKDLLYYMDDNLLRNRKAMDDLSSDNNDNATDSHTSPEVKYKVIKVKSLHPNRRRMTYRRFIQEEKPEGVAIISLDEQPFPEFHLPRSRRQYMLDRDSAEMSDAEPPTDNLINTSQNDTLS